MPFFSDPIYTRRQWQRTPIESPVTITSLGEGEREVSAHTIDISQGGMSVALAHPLEIAGRVRVRCCLPNSNYALETVVKVKYRDGDRCGLQFETLSTRDQRELRKLCNALVDEAPKQPS